MVIYTIVLKLRTDINSYSFNVPSRNLKVYSKPYSEHYTRNKFKLAHWTQDAN